MLLTWLSSKLSMHTDTLQQLTVYSADDCEEGDIRLVGGNAANEGRVEVCVNGVWGTVCHDQWGVEDARVACRQLNQPTNC